jgi:hypothetical protein
MGVAPTLEQVAKSERRAKIPMARREYLSLGTGVSGAEKSPGNLTVTRGNKVVQFRKTSDSRRLRLSGMLRYDIKERLRLFQSVLI